MRLCVCGYLRWVIVGFTTRLTTWPPHQEIPSCNALCSLKCFSFSREDSCGLLPHGWGRWYFLPTVFWVGREVDIPVVMCFLCLIPLRSVLCLALVCSVLRPSLWPTQYHRVWILCVVEANVSLPISLSSLQALGL
jgi:hypothetical protein